MSARVRSVVLLSGGLDSLVSLARATRERDVRLVLFFDYGQRARDSERVSAMEAANFYGLPFADVDIRWLEALAPEGMRRTGAADAPLSALGDVWIPNRNGVFVNIAAAYAEGRGCETVVTGFNREEAEEFPDNSAEFVARSNAALALSTRNGVLVESFTIDLDKPEIIRLGLQLRAPLSIIWSCYRSGEHMCGACASCSRLRAALDTLPPEERPVIEFAA
jgi:7-cyano-7-deazaguanine synthase